MEQCEVYCLTYNDANKYASMVKRFEQLGIHDVRFYLGTKDNDRRLSGANNRLVKRQWAMTYSHLDMIYDFYYVSDKKYAIICEDDIVIHHKLVHMMKHIVSDFTCMGLDLLLLGYMIPYKLSPRNLYLNYPLKHPMRSTATFTYHEYPGYLSGSQMYMIHKPFAKHVLTKYYGVTRDIDRTFFVDKTILKEANRAILYPMVALENDDQHDEYHKLCRKIHDNDMFI